MIGTTHHIAFGDPGVEKTLRFMRKIVLDSAKNARVVEWAQGVVRYTQERDPDAMAQAFLNWVRANVRYTEDPLEVESVKTPEAMLIELQRHGRITGDCDDQVVMLAAGLNAVGVDTEFIVVAADASSDDYSHVLLQYQSRGGEFITMDPIVRGSGPGWFPPRHSRVGYYRGNRLTNNRGGGSGFGILALAVFGYCILKAGR